MGSNFPFLWSGRFFIMIYDKPFLNIFNGITMKSLLSIPILSFLLLGCVQPTDTDINTAGNSDPVINGITINPVFIRVGTTTTVIVDATDPDGDNLSYSWSVALGDIIGSGNQVRYTAAYCCVGINTINVVVKDSKGAKVSGSVNIEINP